MLMGAPPVIKSIQAAASPSSHRPATFGLRPVAHRHGRRLPLTVWPGRQWATRIRAPDARPRESCSSRDRRPMTTMTHASPRGAGMTSEEKFVIFASSLGTVFELYDFYLYATLAPFFAAVFFPPGNATAALLSAFATYAAGFLVRPFGELVFGRIGDLVGRKYTFLV